MQWSGFESDRTCELLEQCGFRIERAGVRSQQ
jgi:hypothetical protein